MRAKRRSLALAAVAGAGAVAEEAAEEAVADPGRPNWSTAKTGRSSRVDAARLLIWRAASNAQAGLPSILDSSVAKCFANEAAKRVSDLAMQLHGGYGYAEEYGLERLQRDAHGWALAGGTGNMQRIRIASAYLGRRFDQRMPL